MKLANNIYVVKYKYLISVNNMKIYSKILTRLKFSNYKFEILLN